MISYEEFLENFQKASAYYQEILQYILENKFTTASLKYTDNKRNQEMIAKMLEQFLEHPDRFMELNLEYVNNFQKLVSDTVNKFIGKQHEHNKNEEELGDRRFKDPAWQQGIYFDFIKHYYFITSDWMKKSVQQYDFDESGKKYAEFAAQQFIDAASPSNFAFSNPEVIRESLESGMENIVKGMENFLEDIKKPGGLFNISTTDRTYFKIGKDLAVTKGKVIYQNDLMQLICYQPVQKVRSIPVFIIPPWINKYYILDLSEKNSLVKWLVDNNFQVFLVSWVNPKKKLADKDFEHYLKEGILEPYRQIKKLGYKEVNAVGYCIGGTLLASALSYLKERGKDWINSATFLTTLIDFADPGEIGVLINKSSLDLVEKEVNAKGYLDGSYLSNSFSLIRANDLIWSFFVNNYLLGKAPSAFDILYWNSDSTNLPAKMYIYYLRNMYIDNKLIQPCALTMLGTRLDVSKIDVPSFSLAAKGDHIALWKSVYDGYKLLGGDKTFCLTDAGHIAGVVNPPDNRKYSYMLSNEIPKSAVSWLKQASHHKGSWWNAWKKWLIGRSGKLEKCMDYEKLDFIEPAPGSYVRR